MGGYYSRILMFANISREIKYAYYTRVRIIVKILRIPFRDFDEFTRFEVPQV